MEDLSKKEILDMTRHLPSGNSELAVYLKNRSQIKLRDLVNIEPLKEVLRYCVVLVGIKKESMPSDAQKSVLIDFLINRLGGYSPNEIKHAFLLAVEGKLNVSVTAYQSFDSVYVSDILKAYKNYIVQKNYHRKETQEPIKKEITENEKRAVLKVFFLDLIDRYKKSLKSLRSEINDEYGVVYDQLTRLGIMNATTQEKINAFEKAKLLTFIVNIGDANDRRAFKAFKECHFKNGSGDRSNVYYIKCKQQSKSILTDQFIKKSIKENRDLEAEIKKHFEL